MTSKSLESIIFYSYLILWVGVSVSVAGLFTGLINDLAVALNQDTPRYEFILFISIPALMVAVISGFAIWVCLKLLKKSEKRLNEEATQRD